MITVDGIVLTTSTAAALSDATPEPLGVADAGIALEAARADHVHAKPTIGGTTAAGGTGSVTGSTATTTTATMASYNTPAAAGVEIHAAIPADNAAPVTSAITNPAIPRNVQIVFSASWDGGDINLDGVDYPAGASVSETITGTPGATVAGNRAWTSITSINNTAAGTVTETATVQTGAKLGLPVVPTSPGCIAVCDGAIDNASISTTYSTVTFASAPNGSHRYVVTYAAEHLHAAGTLAGPSHTHGGTGLTQ